MEIKQIGKFTIVWSRNVDGYAHKVEMFPGDMTMKDNGEIIGRNRSVSYLNNSHDYAQGHYRELIRYALRQPDVNIYHLLNRSIHNEKKN